MSDLENEALRTLVERARGLDPTLTAGEMNALVSWMRAHAVFVGLSAHDAILLGSLVGWDLGRHARSGRTPALLETAARHAEARSTRWDDPIAVARALRAVADVVRPIWP